MRVPFFLFQKIGSGDCSCLKRNKSSYTGFTVANACIYGFQQSQPFASKKEVRTSSASRPESLVLLAVEWWCSVWQAVCICPLLRNIAHRHSICQPAYQTSNMSQLPTFDWQSGYGSQSQSKWCFLFFFFCPSTMCRDTLQLCPYVINYFAVKKSDTFSNSAEHERNDQKKSLRLLVRITTITRLPALVFALGGMQFLRPWVKVDMKRKVVKKLQCVPNYIAAYCATTTSLINVIIARFLGEQIEWADQGIISFQTLQYHTGLKFYLQFCSLVKYKCMFWVSVSCSVIWDDSHVFPFSTRDILTFVINGLV